MSAYEYQTHDYDVVVVGVAAGAARGAARGAGARSERGVLP